MNKILLSLPLLSILSFKVQATTMSLKDALERVSTQNLEFAIEEYKIEQAQTDIARVKAEFNPKLDATLGAGPINKATGDSLNSTEDKNRWGALYIGSIEFTWPIYSWGRKSDYLKAANAGVEVKAQDKKLKELEIRYNIKKTYFGVLYATSLLDFVKGTKDDLSKALDNKKLSPKDRFRLEILMEQINSKEAEIKKNLDLAQRGLRLYTGCVDPTMKMKDEWLEIIDRELKDLNYYVQIAKDEKPEIQKLNRGIEAKHSLSKAEFKGNYPIFAFLTKYDFAYTNMRNAQKSAFAYDPYNGTNAVIGIGLKWTFDFGVTNAKSAKVYAEALELEAQRRYADEGIPTLVEKAWLEVKEAEVNLAANKRASKLGKQWLAKFMGGASLGVISDTKEMIEAYQARLLTLKDYYEAIYKHHMAWAELSLAVGKEVDPTL